MREGVLIALLAGGLLGPGWAAGADLELGGKVYQQKCGACHGADGKGNPRVARSLKTTIPDLTRPGADEAETRRIIAEGKGRMPGYAKSLSKEELRAVTDYTRSLAGSGR